MWGASEIYDYQGSITKGHPLEFREEKIAIPICNEFEIEMDMTKIFYICTDNSGFFREKKKEIEGKPKQWQKRNLDGSGCEYKAEIEFSNFCENCYDCNVSGAYSSNLFKGNIVLENGKFQFNTFNSKLSHK